jgi:ribonuclease P protein component
MSRQANSGGRERFGGEHRLRRRRDYLTVYEQGARAHGRLAVVFALRRADDAPWRLGLTATVKLGGAVTRNRLRRAGREVFRRWGAELPQGWDFVLNFKHAAREADQAELKRDLLTCLRRLGIEPEPARAGIGGLGEGNPPNPSERPA